MGSLGEKLSILAIIFTMMSITASPHPLLLLLCYGIHELGHIFFAKINGAEIKKIKVGVFHLSMSYDCSGLTYAKELAVQSGGVIFNLLTALALYLLPVPDGEAKSFFVVGSVFLALMNLYPVSVLDGGGIIKNLFLMILPQHVAEKLCRIIYFSCAIILWLIAVYLQLVFSSNLSLFIVSVFLLMELCFTFN